MRRGLARLLPLLFLVCSAPAWAESDHLLDHLRALQAARFFPVNDWKFHRPDSPHGEEVGLDDHDWQTVHVGFGWVGEYTNVWFRTRITVPETVNGVPTKGLPMHLRVGADDDGEVYVDGKFRQQFHWDDGNIPLTDHAVPGQTYLVALRGINTFGDGKLLPCRLAFGYVDSWQHGFDRLMQEADFLERIAARADLPQHDQAAQVLRECADMLDPARFPQGDEAAALKTLDAALKLLLPMEPLARQYQVYYVGHAHIDMNWKWSWPETIDVCQRTWDSALKLMSQFPDFGFVQSQPAAYAPIQQQFPAEFARMQQAVRKGQWDLVGGLWDESDTNMPSGEGLARSLFLGQRYFKAQFGRYATTGWLPDSFGHSWQLPQLFAGVGIHNFYHQRAGDAIRFAWWQSPDGTRLLKANTDEYNANIDPSQMMEPLENERRFQIKESLVVFGVGDHGGGPTRAQILKGKGFQESPLLPQVYFLTADAFFEHLRAAPQATSFPVVDTDLQYVAPGCYTTHADIKAAVRGSENDLYTAETFASLAAQQGRAYPVQGFAEAWKPAAFAQFHDIMCGTAIHSSYDWMKAQMAPARRFAAAQTAQSLAALTAALDTRGGKAGGAPVVVWNALSFAREDIAHVQVPDPAAIHSVLDEAGVRHPVQAEVNHSIAFIASVPGFGHATYYLSSAPCPPVAGGVRATADSYTLESPTLRLAVARDTGLITSLFYKPTGRELIAPDRPANVLQVLGDGESAWDIRFNGRLTPLTTQGAKVTLIADGPVYATIREEHAFRRSTFQQDLTFYRQLPRIDVPTAVGWHEHLTMLKVAFPLNMTRPACRVGIPYGSIARPHNGQENPGQKWMDVTEERPSALKAATPLDLSPLFNHDSGPNFDTEGRGYPRAELPPPGLASYGALKVPIRFAERAATGPDNVACQSQTLAIPAGAVGNTLFLVGAGAPGEQESALIFVQPGGRRTVRHLPLNDWIRTDQESGELVATLPYQTIDRGADRNSEGKPKLWLVGVPAPVGDTITQVILPEERRMHLFAATLAEVTPSTPDFGLSVLNDSKYGSDTNGAVFRLSLLRSSMDPDPNPDEGLQIFTYALWPHAGDSNDGQAEQAGLALNIPLRTVLTAPHPGKPAGRKAGPITIATADHRSDLVAGALKHCEDGPGYILRLFETQGHDATAILTFSQPVHVVETDLLERPLAKQRLAVNGRMLRMPVGHDQIVTLHITGLPDAGLSADKPR